VRRALFTGQLPKDHPDVSALEITFDDAQMRNVSRQSVHVVYDNSLEAALLCVIAKLVKRRPC
jgi:hypothetical protein